MTTAVYKTLKHTFAVGDDVSRGFGGDWYYEGKVVRVTPKFLTTETGRKFSLRVYTSRLWMDDAYRNVEIEQFCGTGGSSWVLIKGNVEKQNPHV